MNDEKKVTYFVDHEGQWVYTGDLDTTMDYLRSYVAELKDGGDVTMEARRHDMTEADADALPELQ